MTPFFTGTDLLRAVADHLWQSTICVAAFALLARLTRQTHPRAQVWIWLAASLKFWIPFATLIALGSWASRQAPGFTSLDSMRAASYVVVQVASEPFSGTMRALDVGAASMADRAFPWLMVLCAVWVSGASIVSGRWLGRWRRVRHLAAQAHVAITGREVNALARASAAMGLAAPPRIALTPASIEPGVLGVMRMTVLWPVGLSEHLDDDQLYAVMLHELSHARRGDNVMAMAHMLVELAFWFYPVVWWVGSRLVDARELACDEDVVRFSDAPSVYAASLLKTCQYCLESPLDCVPGVTGSELKGRIETIMRTRFSTRLSTWRRTAITGVIAASFVAPIVAGGVNGTVTNVWRGGVSLPEEPPRPELPSLSLSPNTLSLDEAFRMVTVPSLSRETVIDAIPASSPLVSSQTPSIGDPGQAQPVDAFRLGAPSMPKPAPTTPAEPARDGELEDVLLSGLGRTDLSLSVTVNFRQLNTAEYLVPVSIRIAPGSELLTGRGRTSRLDFVTRVADINGITYGGRRDTVELILGPASIADLATKPIIYETAFTLLPGRYKLKVLARDQTTGRIGTSEAMFTIPNLARQQQPVQ